MEYNFEKISSGKYAGHTLPWVFFRDPFFFNNNLLDVFFGMRNNKLKFELIEIRRLIASVSNPTRMTYILFRDKRGQIQQIIERPNDFTFSNEDDTNDSWDFTSFKKRTYKSLSIANDLIRILKYSHFRDGSYRMTEKRSQEFFLKSENFGLTESSFKSTNDAASVPEPKPIRKSTPKTKVATSSIIKYLQLHVPTVIFETIDKLFSNKTQRKRAKNVIYHIIKKHHILGFPIVKFIGYPEKTKQRLLTTRHYKCWQLMVDAGILQLYSNRDGQSFHWIKGIPKRYRINPKYIRKPFERIDVSLDMKEYTVDKEDEVVGYTSESLSHIALEKPSESEYKKLLSSIKMKLVVKTHVKYFNYDKIEDINNGLQADQISMDMDRADIFDFDIHMGVDGMIHKLKLLQEHIHYVSRSNLNGRLNHNLTNLDKVLFPFLRLNHEVIVEIDMSNSQPLIFAKLLYNILHDNHDDIISDSILYQYILNNTPPHTPKPTLLSSHFDIEKVKTLKEEVIQFKQWCENGVFYEKIPVIERYGEKLKRNEMKMAFTKVMFGKYNQTNKMKLSIKQLFPTLVELLDGLKNTMYQYYNSVISEKQSINESLMKYMYSNAQGSKSPFDSGNDYLAIRLQEIEAKIFIDRLLRRLLQNGIIAFSRHDSICCKESDMERVVVLLNEELDIVLGKGEYKMKISRWE